MEDESHEEDEREIRLFLAESSVYHMGHVISYHSWPCGLWQTGRPVTSITWTDLFSHGLVPKNWRTFTEEPI